MSESDELRMLLVAYARQVERISGSSRSDLRALCRQLSSTMKVAADAAPEDISKFYMATRRYTAEIASTES